MTQTLLDKIKSTGYWRVNIRPTRFEENRIPNLETCREIVESSRVLLRGWDYPPFDPQIIRNGQDWVELECDLEGFTTRHVEYWRFYQSGQFIHYFACNEDYTQVNPAKYDGLMPSPSGQYLSILSTLYTVTEIFEFSARLSSRNVLLPAAEISINLKQMGGRRLAYFDPFRAPLYREYVCGIPEISFSKTYPQEELLSVASDFALDATLWIFERFNWMDAPRSVLSEDQKKLLERRL